MRRADLLPSHRQHRRTIVLALKDPSRELPFTTRALSFDSKNYHTWAYRQWVLCEFFSSGDKAHADVWEGEIKYVEELLKEDLRNNSAWNHRFFVVFESGQGGGERKEIGDREIRCASLFSLLSSNRTDAAEH